MTRIYLSPPDVSGSDKEAVLRAFDSGWVAPLGPEVDAFERELADVTGRSHAIALSSGTAALHLALLLAGVGPGDRVLISTLTFAATANAAHYVGADPVFIDSDAATWNMDTGLLAEALSDGPYAACIPVDIYGQCADYEGIAELCARAGVPIISDAAESLGASHRGRPAGSFGDMAALSFNGNKIITTSGGGALLTDDAEAAERARFLATQARDPAPHYQHTEIGFNYRLSNLLAALGRSQLADLERRIAVRRQHFESYRSELGSLPGVEFMPIPEWSEPNYWLTVMTVDPAAAGVGREEVRVHLEGLDIESRPLWKPMHMQPVFAGRRTYGGEVATALFDHGLCLPSGSSLDEGARRRVIAAIKSVLSR